MHKSTPMNVSIEDLTFKTIIGILPFERVTKQKVIVTLHFQYKFKKDQKDFVDYSHVANMAKLIIKKEKFLLIEDAIIYLQRALKNEFNISKLQIKISKPDILKDCLVSVGN